MRRILLLTPLLFVAGCMVGPKYKLPPVQVPTAFKEPPPESFKEFHPAKPNDDTIRGKWWEMFGDPQLNALEEQVNINNQTIAQAAAVFEEARASVRQARAGLFPTIGVTPGITRSRQSANSVFGVGNTIGVPLTSTTTGTTTSTGSTGSTSGGSGSSASSVSGGGVRGRAYTNYQIPFSFSYEADAWGRIRNQIAANSFNAQASAADLQTARLSAQAELATDYFELRGSDTSRALLERSVADYEKQLGLTQYRFNQGVATQLDVEQARTQLESTRAQLIDTGVARAQYEHAIAVFTGKAPASLTLEVRPIDIQPPAIPVALPSELLQRRPDIAGAERRVASANAQIGLAIAAYYPSISLSASAGLASSAIATLIDWPSRIWSVGPQLAQTLFDGGERRAVTQQARATYDAQVAAYRQAVLTAFQGVEDNLSTMRILETEGTQENLAIRSAQRSVELAVLRYNQGLDTELDVLTAEAAELTAESNAIGILTRRMTAAVGLIQALGGGWNSSEIPDAKALSSKR